MSTEDREEVRIAKNGVRGYLYEVQYSGKYLYCHAQLEH
jgi:hypothetical protein